MKTSSDHFADAAVLIRRIRTAFILFVIALGGPALLEAQLSDDFNDGNDDGWTRYDPISTGGFPAQNQWTFPSGGYRLQAAATPSAPLGPGRVGSLRQANVYNSSYIAADLVAWDDSLTEAVTVAARIQPNPGLGATSGYFFGYVTGAGHYAQIVRVTGERTFSIAGSPLVPVTLNPAKHYRLVFTAQGSELAGRIYELPNTDTPLVSLAATDTTYTSGTAGLLAFSLSATPQAVDVTFDNYWALDHIPPRLSIQINSFAEVIVSWPMSAPGYVLESSPILPAGTWTEVPDVTPSGDVFLHTEDATSGNKYFRVRKSTAPAP